MPVAPQVPTGSGSFRHRGHRLAYTEYGEGARWVVLMPGLLLPGSMQEPLARRIAEHGNHVVVLDPLGHGRSDRPGDMSEYSVESFAGDVVALLDHLDVDEWRRTARSAAESQPRHWSSGTTATPCTPSPTPACWCTSCRRGRLCEASHILELRLNPERISRVIDDFIDECWAPQVRPAARPARRARSANRLRRAGAR